MITYGKPLQEFAAPLIINMKVLVLCLAFSISVCSGVEPQRDFYTEKTRNQLEELGRFLKRSQQYPYHFPEYPAEAVPFAVGPSDPRYYQDDLRFRTGPDRIVPNLLTRNSPPWPPSEPQVESEEVEELRAGREEEEEEEQEVEKIQAPSPSPAPPAEDGKKDKTHASLVQAVDQRPILADPVDNSDLYFIAIVAGCCAAAVVGIIAVGISWYRLQKSAKAAADVEYPAYGVTGPNKEVSPTGDRRLAQSAQMYHYQHQKQQIIAMESRLSGERNGSLSEAESDEENEEGDYTVYECPGLAPTGEMEVKNPLFQDDPTPATPAPASKDQPTSQDRSSNKP